MCLHLVREQQCGAYIYGKHLSWLGKGIRSQSRLLSFPGWLLWLACYGASCCLVTYSAGQPQVQSSYALFHVDHMFGAIAAITPSCALPIPSWQHQTMHCQQEATLWPDVSAQAKQCSQSRAPAERWWVQEKYDPLMDARSQQTLPDSLGQTATRQAPFCSRELSLGTPGCRLGGKQRSSLWVLRSFLHCRLFWLKNIYQPFGKFISFLETKNANLLNKEGHTVSWINSPALSCCRCAWSASIFCGTLDPCLLQAEMAQKAK